MRVSHALALFCLAATAFAAGDGSRSYEEWAKKNAKNFEAKCGIPCSDPRVKGYCGKTVVCKRTHIDVSQVCPTACKGKKSKSSSSSSSSAAAKKAKKQGKKSKKAKKGKKMRGGKKKQESSSRSHESNEPSSESSSVQKKKAAPKKVDTPFREMWRTYRTTCHSLKRMGKCGKKHRGADVSTLCPASCKASKASKAVLTDNDDKMQRLCKSPCAWVKSHCGNKLSCYDKEVDVSATCPRTCGVQRQVLQSTDLEAEIPTVQIVQEDTFLSTDMFIGVLIGLILAGVGFLVKERCVGQDKQDFDVEDVETAEGKPLVSYQSHAVMVSN